MLSPLVFPGKLGAIANALQKVAVGAAVLVCYGANGVGDVNLISARTQRTEAV